MGNDSHSTRYSLNSVKESMCDMLNSLVFGVWGLDEDRKTAASLER